MDCDAAQEKSVLEGNMQCVALLSIAIIVAWRFRRGEGDGSMEGLLDYSSTRNENIAKTANLPVSRPSFYRSWGTKGPTSRLGIELTLPCCRSLVGLHHYPLQTRSNFARAFASD